MFKLLGRIVSRGWWGLLIFWAAACVLSLGAPKLSEVGVDDSIDFLSKEADSVRARNLLKQAFPEDVHQTSAVVVVQAPGGVNEQVEELVRRLSTAIRRMKLYPMGFLPKDWSPRMLSLPQPAAAPSVHVDEQAGTPLMGAYRYCWRYVGADDGDVIHSPSSRMTAKLTLDGQAVVLSGLADSADPRVTGKELFRSRADDPTTFYRIATLSPGQTSHTDRLADGGLVEKPNLMVPLIREVTDLSEPVVGRRLVSADRKATIINVPMDSYWVAERSLQTVKYLRRAIDRTLGQWREGLKEQGGEAPAVEVYATGHAPIGLDYANEAADSVDRTEVTTYIMVIAILLLVYRSPLLALIPLVTVGVGVTCSWAVLAELALGAQALKLEFKVINITDIFVIVILFGAGTDYCLFLIARAKEGLDEDLSVREAVGQSVEKVGGAVAASAGTVICGLGMMIFAAFAKYRYTGPAVAVSLGIGLCASLTLAPSLLCLLGRSAFWSPLSRRSLRWMASKFGWKPGPEKPRRTESVFWERVSRILARRPGLILAVSLLLMMPLAWLGSGVDVTYDLLQELPPDAESRQGFSIIKARFPLGEIDPIELLIESPAADFGSPPAAAGGPPSSQAAPQPTAARRRAVSGAVARLCDRLADTPGIYQVRSVTRPLGEPGLTDASGEHTLKVPIVGPLVERLKDTTAMSFLRQLPGALGRGADSLLDRFEEDSRREFRRMVQREYVSSTGEKAGRVTRIKIVLDDEPFTVKSMRKLEELRHVIGGQLNDSADPLHGMTFSFTGGTAITNDLRRVTESDRQRISILTVLGIFVILVLLLRRVGVSLYLILSVVFGFYVTMGVTRLVFIHWLGYPGLHWTVPFFLFVLLIAVGEDYNIFLMSRVEEESRRHGPVEGTRIAVARTGAIITSCGLIMTGTFGSMLTGTLSMLRELGFALAFGVLLDTFVVRPILVPAFLLLVHRLLGRK